MLNLEEVKIENEDLQAEVDQLRNQLVFAEENNARRIREIKTESSNEVKVFSCDDQVTDRSESARDFYNFVGPGSARSGTIRFWSVDPW